jgi:hypothetical protein
MFHLQYHIDFLHLDFKTVEKQFKSISPIAIGEVTYCLVAHTLAIQFKDTIMKHFNLHQFGLAIRGEC